MGKYILSCCSTADISEEHLKNIDVKYIYFHFEIDGREYPDDFGKSIPLKEFYRKMKEGAMTKTSQVNVGEFCEFFRPYLEEGYDILHICLSSGISGVLNSCETAKKMLEEEYPERTIKVVDSLSASSGYGLFVDYLAGLKNNGASLSELYDMAMEKRNYVNQWFFTTDLTYLIRGGRVSKAAGIVGQILNICPLLEVAYDGSLAVRYKIRGKKKVISAIVDKMKELTEEGILYSGSCYISHSDCMDDAAAVKDLIEETFPGLKGKVLINDIGTTIGSHTGPGTVALFYWGKKRISR